ncbi:MAG: hypothetical protein IJK81_09105 [Selenomonadaceae bacterium]|nr:hypothetical protein [Selenomonadaceae bacterium]
MRTLKIFGLAFLMIFVAQVKTFAAMPEVSAGETYFDLFKGAYVLKNNVHVAVDNHGFRATVTADGAIVSVTQQKCWADGNVKLTQENIIFSCDHVYIEGATHTAKVKGKVKFENKNSATITSDTAVFNWDNKIVDFYGKVTLKSDKKVKLADGLTLDGKDYQHIQYNVVEDTILALDKTFNAPDVTIPDVNS